MREKRKQSSSDIYHVVARGTGRQIIFEEDVDYNQFLGTARKVLSDSGCELYAWCLMSNHVHLLIHAEIEKLSTAMRRILGSYAMYFNAKSGRVGHLFQERFASEPVNDDAYLITVVRYIHQNPVKAGLSAVDNYPWSSYGEFVGKPSTCETSFVLGVFGGIEEFVRLHGDDTSGQCLDIPQPRRTAPSLPDEKERAAAERVLEKQGLTLEDIKGLDPARRNQVLVELKQTGLTVRQIERLTGVGRATVQRAKR